MLRATTQQQLHSTAMCPLALLAASHCAAGTLTLWCSKADAEQLHLVLAVSIVYC